MIESQMAQPFFLQGGKHGILMLHGFTGSVAHMRPLGEDLNQAGFTVCGINLPGHGSEPEAMQDVYAEDWIKAAEKALKELHETCTITTVCGLSMGAVIALILGSEGLTDQVVSISAPMPAKNIFLPAAPALQYVMHSIPFKKDRERIMALDQRYDVGYDHCPTCAAVQLQRIIQMGKERLSQIACPLLCIQSHADQSVHPASARHIMEAVKSTNKEILYLENVPHVCTISSARLLIAKRITSFLLL